MLLTKDVKTLVLVEKETDNNTKELLGSKGACVVLEMLNWMVFCSVRQGLTCHLQVLLAEIP